MNYCSLGEVAKIDRRIATDEDCRRLPYVGLEHIEKDTGNFIDGFVPHPERVLAAKFRFSIDHVLYGKLRPYLNKVTVPRFSGVCTTEILPILPNPQKLDKHYLWAFLLSAPFVKWATEQVAGANLPRLDPGMLVDYPIPLPSLPEQQRIGAILQKADRVRRLRRYARLLSEGYLQSLFFEMFGDPISNEKEHTFQLLGELSYIASGVTKGQDYGKLETVEFPYLRVANVQAGYLDLREIKSIRVPIEEARELWLKSGDILMTEGGDFDKLGRGAIWQEQIQNCIHQNHIFRVRLKQELVLPEFFEHFLQSRFAKHYFLSASKQTTNLATINMTQLKALPVPVPAMQDQQKFVLIRNQFKKVQNQVIESSRQAEHLFQSLLSRAFSGDL